ncbi:MAG: CDP-glucose 4,6-dehydratase, partial [Chitinophagia bacterium]|nr:CDP-glucose 4,6-dehydratase [Chitinophagia bacterium]
LPPEKDNDLYNLVDGETLCTESVYADICDQERLREEIIAFEPHFVFHFAAQSLVRRGYQRPDYTFAVNTQGTAEVLEAFRHLVPPAVAIMITTDKVYDNPERGIPFHEDDKLGGYDPYSASKAAAEIVIDSYRRSFFNPADYTNHDKAVASARAGNVIGGGDNSDDRIIPDIVRAITFGETVGLRNPNSIRPWQHVLEPLGAYLLLGAKMSEDFTRYCTAYNFGPNPADMLTVEELTKVFIDSFGKGSYRAFQEEGARHEAKLLLLDSTRAETQLGWKSVLDARTAIHWTATWYADTTTPAHEKCLAQIKQYFEP